MVCGYCGWRLDDGGDFCAKTGDTHTLAVCRDELARQLRGARALRPVCPDCLHDVPGHRAWCGTIRRGDAIRAASDAYDLGVRDGGRACEKPCAPRGTVPGIPGSFWESVCERVRGHAGACFAVPVSYDTAAPACGKRWPKFTHQGVPDGTHGPCALALGHRGPCGAVGQW